jgi:deoxyadenosine/deoxycytidine kinase
MHIRLPVRPLVIVEGNIGAGKSTAAKRLAKLLNYRLLHEPVDPVFLDAFYKDMARLSFAFQVKMLHERWAMQISAAAETMVDGGFDGAMLDRSLWGDFVFAEALTEMGHIHSEEFKIYLSAVRNMALVLFPPTVLLYLSARPETCLTRIRERNRPQEQGITWEYLQRLHDGYQRMIKDAKTAAWPWSHAVQILPVPWDPRTVTDEEWTRVAAMVREASAR